MSKRLHRISAEFVYYVWLDADEADEQDPGGYLTEAARDLDAYNTDLSLSDPTADALRRDKWGASIPYGCDRNSNRTCAELLALQEAAEKESAAFEAHPKLPLDDDDEPPLTELSDERG